jgi:peptidoglycan/xylan/chitin deacetylase (PgdA/CDA1 family)
MQLAPLYPWLYKLLQPTFSNCLWAGNCNSRAIALTFDDGPHPQHTVQLLKVLDQFQVVATFFWLGLCVERYPDVARAVYQQGHSLGLHGYNHQSFPTLRANQLKDQLEQTQTAIAAACQLDSAAVRRSIRDVRPPNGLFTPFTLAQLRQWGYRPVMWSVVPEDWVSPGETVVTQRVLAQARNGALIVLHDGHCGGADVAAIAAAIIPRLLDQLDSAKFLKRIAVGVNRWI